MKFGARKPSFKKSIKARTTGRINRSVKRAVNPLYGKKGVGFVKDPSRSIKNAVYKRTTFSVFGHGGSSKKAASSSGSTIDLGYTPSEKKPRKHIQINWNAVGIGAQWFFAVVFLFAAFGAGNIIATVLAIASALMLCPAFPVRKKLNTMPCVVISIVLMMIATNL